MFDTPLNYFPESSSEQHNNNEIITERLTLKSVQPDDVPVLARLWTDESVRAHLGGTTDIETAKLKAHIGKVGSFSIHESAVEAIVGLSEIGRYRTGDLEVSYQLLPEAWGKGYGREAVSATIRWGLDNNDDDQIVAITQSSNAPSRKLLESLGMSLIDEFEEYGEMQTMYAIARENIAKV